MHRFILIALLPYVLGQTGRWRCPGENEEIRWRSCDGTCLQPDGDRCYAARRYDCFCREGYVRNQSGECIKLDQCQQVCGFNEEYRMGGCDQVCGWGEQQCDQPETMGCFCQAGHARDIWYRCVPLAYCDYYGGRNTMMPMSPPFNPFPWMSNFFGGLFGNPNPSVGATFPPISGPFPSMPIGPAAGPGRVYNVPGATIFMGPGTAAITSGGPLPGGNGVFSAGAFSSTVPQNRG